MKNIISLSTFTITEIKDLIERFFGTSKPYRLQPVSVYQPMIAEKK